MTLQKQIDATRTANGRSWKSITEVRASEMRRLRRSKWQELYDDILLRLEQTMPQYALKVEFEDAELTRKARHALNKKFRKEQEAGYVDFAVIGNLLYVRRGPNWKKP